MPHSNATMSSINKQLVLHGLNVPLEIIHIIKDYAFMNITMSKSKKRKNVILRLISNTIWCGRSRPQDENEGAMVFWINEDDHGPQIQTTFCKKCGDYIIHGNSTDEEGLDRVACRCFII